MKVVVYFFNLAPSRVRQKASHQKRGDWHQICKSVDEKGGKLHLFIFASRRKTYLVTTL